MTAINQTTITGFRPKRPSDVSELQVLTFLLVLLIYLISLIGNLSILLLVCFNLQLHTPMYFFICNLSVINISISTTKLHTIFVILINQNNTISTWSCLTYLFIFSSLHVNEISILAAMSYDRYVAICKPLHYHTIMSGRLCGLLASVSSGFGFIEALPATVLFSKFPCYISKEIDHYFCHRVPIRDITLSVTRDLDLYILIFGNASIIILLSLTLSPYVLIIVCILRISSSAGRRKAFYTCSSHITVVVTFYSSIVIQYIGTVSGNKMGSNKICSLFNTAIVPMMNPLIYNLKNKDIKSALQRKLNLCGIKY